MQERTETIQPEEQRVERVQVTLRLPKMLHDALDQTRPQDQALNPYIVEVLEAGLAAKTVGFSSLVDSARTETVSPELITRAEAHRAVTNVIDVLVRRTGSRIDTRDIEGVPAARGLRTLVKEALLPSQ